MTGLAATAAAPHAPPLQVARNDSPQGRWELVQRPPHPALRAHVSRYAGWVERTPGPLRRRELPVAAIPVIISFGPPFHLVHPDDPRRRHRRVSFVAGLDDRYTIVEHDGESRGVEISFTPLGARRVLGCPLGDLARRVVELEDVLGAGPVARLTERLALASGWAERFALLDALIARRLADAPELPPALRWAWQRLEETDGGVAVAALAQEVGWSRRHFVAQVREQLGLPPKTVARVLRFQRAVERLGRDDGAQLAQIALDCGYYDQAHFTRDFRAFAGDPPAAFLARRLTASAGWSA